MGGGWKGWWEAKGFERCGDGSQNDGEKRRSSRPSARLRNNKKMISNVHRGNACRERTGYVWNETSAKSCAVCWRLHADVLEKAS